MTLKKTVILLVFSLCLNAGFLITALWSHRFIAPHGQKYSMRPYARHIELLKRVNLPPEAFQRAKKNLDTFMEKRAALIAEKLDEKIETIVLLRNNPQFSRQELEARHLKEDAIDGKLSTLSIDYTLEMRKILPRDKMTVFYINAEKLIQAHRDKIIGSRE